MAEADERVCPRCGTPADHNAYCSECGFDLSAQEELPTHRQWIEERREPTGETTPSGTDSPSGGGAAPPPPSAKAGRPSFLRPVPLMIAAGVLIAAVVVILVVASGGGGGGSQESFQKGLEATLAGSPYGVESPKVECPSSVEFETGQTVECNASAADGTTANVEAEVTSTSGEGEFSIENLIPTESVANQCSKEMAEFVETTGIATGSCEVECPELAEAKPNGKLSCHYSLEEEGRGGTVEIPLGSDGKTPEGGWEATEE